MHWCFLLFLFCYSSILHARHHSSQQVCRHRITGQQLSKHPAADTGRILGYIPAGCLCPSKGGVTLSALTVMTTRTLEAYKHVNACQNLLCPHSQKSAAGFPPPLLAHHPIAHYQCAFVFYNMHILPYVLNSLFGTYAANTSGDRPSPSLPFSFPLLLTSPFWSPLQCFNYCVTSASSRLFIFCISLSPISPSLFLPFTTVPHSYASSMSAGLESLVSNHTHLEPVQLSSTTHGNHLKLLSGSAPFFLCSLTFSVFPFPSVLILFCLCTFFLPHSDFISCSNLCLSNLFLLFLIAFFLPMHLFSK